LVVNKVFNSISGSSDESSLDSEDSEVSVHSSSESFDGFTDDKDYINRLNNPTPEPCDMVEAYKRSNAVAEATR